MDIPKYKLSLAEIVAATGECEPIVNDAAKLGHLETFLVGRRRFARPEAVKRWIDFLEAESKAGRPLAYRARKQEAA